MYKSTEKCQCISKVLRLKNIENTYRGLTIFNFDTKECFIEYLKEKKEKNEFIILCRFIT